MIERLARLGYVSKAVIYAIVGGLALSAAAGRGGSVTDANGALRVLLTQPLGNTVLYVLAVGLCGYALWRFLDAALDPERAGIGPRGLAERIGSLVRGLVYGGLGIEAFRLAHGLRVSGGDNVRLWTARVLELPLGEWMVGIAGLIIVGYGISEVVAAATRQVGSQIDLSPIPSRARGALLKVSRFGVGARAVILVVLGFFLVRAAATKDPSEVHGQRDSILELTRMIDSRWMLVAVACGLLAYAVDQALHARCRRIRSPIA